MPAMGWEESPGGPSAPDVVMGTGAKLQAGWGTLQALPPASAPCFAQRGDVGLAPAQQPPPASTKKEKSRELTAAPRNAAPPCVPGRQLGSAGLSPPPAVAPWGGGLIPPPAKEGTLGAGSASPQHGAGTGNPMLIPCPARAGAEGRGCPCLATLPAAVPGRGPGSSSHDSVRLETTKYTALS